MASITIRTLDRADLEPARWVIYRAYLQVLLELYGPEAADQYEVRSPAFMAMYLDREPQGCFAAVDSSGQLVGALFCFVWGEVGWFGSLAVAPEAQGQGVGQALTAHAVEYLVGRGCRRVGLETWPHAPLVRHLYGKFGFTATRSTVKLTRSAVLPVPDRGQTWEWIDKGQSRKLRRALDAVQQVSDAIAGTEPAAPRPEYRQEIAVPVRAGWADLLVVRDGDGLPAAAALCYVRKPSGAPVNALDVRLLLVVPGAGEEAALDATLGACDARAVAGGAGSVSCDVNLRHGRAATLLRERGFQPIYELLRMERPTAGFDPMARSRTLEAVRWAG